MRSRNPGFIALLILALSASFARAGAKDFDALLALGKLRRGEGRPAEAEAALKRALRLSPDDPDAGAELVQVYDDMGRFADEARLLTALIDKRPRNLPLYAQLARTYAALGRPEEARETFARARRSDGKAAAAYVAEGYFDLESGDPARAEAAFESAIEVDTASAYGYHHLGAYYLKSGKPAEAEKCFRRSLEMLSRDTRASADDRLHSTIGLARSIQAQGRYEEAEHLFIQIVDEAPAGGDRQMRTLRLLARCYAAEGKSDREAEALSRLADDCTRRFECDIDLAGEAMLDLGKLYLGSGRAAEAKAMAERTEALCLKSPIVDALGVLEKLSVFYRALGEDSRNAELYRRLLPLRKTMPSDPALDWVERGAAESEAALGGKAASPRAKP